MVRAVRDRVAAPGDSLSPFAGRAARPVIVGGCPRSGTTLLRSMLHFHPELAMPRETRFVIEAWLRRREFGDLRDIGSRDRLAQWIFRREKSHQRKLGLDPDAAIERLKAAPPTLGSVLATCFAMYAEKHGKARWGDKRPMYAAQMQVVWDLFPQAQFVNVVRDPRACVASMRKLGWYGGRIAPAVEIWERSIRTVDGWRGRLAADQLLEVRYEDLVAEPEAAAARVAAYLGMASDEDAVAQMLSYHEHPETRSERYHANLSRPPDPERVSAWAEALAPGEIAFVQGALGTLMRRFGYEPVAADVPAPAELRREFRRRRRRQALAHRRLLLRDRFLKLVTHRYPLAAEPDLIVPSSPAVGDGRSAGGSP